VLASSKGSGLFSCAYADLAVPKTVLFYNFYTQNVCIVELGEFYVSDRRMRERKSVISEVNSVIFFGPGGGGQPVSRSTVGVYSHRKQYRLKSKLGE
jgi:hypothetical protein